MKDPAVKLARKEYKRRKFQENPEKFRLEKRLWVQKNPEKRAAQRKREYAKSSAEQVRKALEWQRANPERASERKRAYKRSEKGRANAAKPVNRIRNSCSIAVRNFLKGKKSNRPWTSLVDYTMQELMTHIERQFVSGMSWDNYGKWHIDHITPVSSFEITGELNADFSRCFALSNLRPLWAEDNHKKSNKILSLL